MEIEPLLVKIDALSTHFGRVTSDLQAITARGRAQDFRGVMQNTRLVLEAIMRDMVTRELKQTPGKAMLDELISKFRQQTNAGIIPTNILAHMGTVQAWGNLSSHDHAGALSDAGVKVGQEEVVASLNSMVAILNWYAAKLGVQPQSQPGIAAPRPQTLPPVASPPKSRAPVIAGVIGLLACLAGGYWWTSQSPAVAAAPVDPRDAEYRARGEPVPPAACRDAHEDDYQAARKKYESGEVPGPELDRAIACAGFAAALSLAGKVEVRAADAAAKGGDAEGAVAHWGKAARQFDAAVAAAPTFKNARFNRALVLLKQNKLDDGVHDLTELVTADPAFGEAHFYLGVALEAQAKTDASLGARAKAAFCAAAKQGVKLAQSRCDAP